MLPPKATQVTSAHIALAMPVFSKSRKWNSTMDSEGDYLDDYPDVNSPYDYHPLAVGYQGISV